MKKTLLALGLSFGVGTVFTSVASAQLYDHGRYTTDTASGLDWLDLSETIGRTYNQVANGAGGFLDEGWRIATEAELDGLFYPALGIPEDISDGAEGPIDSARDLMSCLGITYFHNVEGQLPVKFSDSGLPVQRVAMGMFDDFDAENKVGLASVNLQSETNQVNFPNGIVRWITYPDWLSASAANFQIGVFLVRDSAGKKGRKCGA